MGGLQGTGPSPIQKSWKHDLTIKKLNNATTRESARWEGCRAQAPALNRNMGYDYFEIY